MKGGSFVEFKISQSVSFFAAAGHIGTGVILMLETPEEVLSVQKVTKYFGDFRALNSVSLRVCAGRICGIVGRNGSGKTVLFKCICGLYGVDDGTIVNHAKRIGAIIEEPGFLTQYSGRKNLQYLASISGVKHIDFDALLKTVGLEQAGNKHVGKYSMGMRQRLGIAQAIMENPDLLVLDEPMNGLDNQGVQEMRELFMKLRDEGTAILLASHNRDDIEQLCDKIYNMDHGVLTLRMENE